MPAASALPGLLEFVYLAPYVGGVRKVRVALPGRGKRGGARFLYFVRLIRGRVYVLTAYTTNVQGDLRSEQRKRIRQVVSDLR